MPPEWACYRFARKLREHGDMLAACIARVVAGLHDKHPDMGRNVASTGPTCPPMRTASGSCSTAARSASGSATRTLPGATGRRSARARAAGSMATRSTWPSAPRLSFPSPGTSAPPAKPSRRTLPLIDTAKTRGFAVETCAMDKGYDARHIYEGCQDRDVRPIIPLIQTTGAKRGDHHTPTCEHGEWRFAGSDSKRGASKWRCPSGECKPASVWIKAERMFPLIPRETPRWKALYRGRTAVEREFGRLKNEWSLTPLRTRGLDRVRLHADLAILAKLACALTRARAVPLAA